MAQVVIGDVSPTSFDAASGSVSHIVAASEGLLVFVALGVVDAAKEVLSVVWDSAGVNEALARPAAIAPLNGIQHNKRLEVWWLAAPTAKTANVTVTMEGGNTQKTGFEAVSTSNFDPTTPFSDYTTLDSSGTASPTTILTQDADDLGIMFFTHELKDSALAPHAGETEIADFNVAGDYRFGAYYEDGDGNITVGGTSAGGSGKAAAIGFTIEAAAAPPVATVLTLENYKRHKAGNNMMITGIG